MRPNLMICVALLLTLAVGCDQLSSTVAAPTQPAAPLPPTMPLPATGVIGPQLPGVAPLTVRTRADGFHYLVKVVAPGSRTPAAQFFIRSGDSVDAMVPLGVYEIKYASGQTWFGNELLFGGATTYAKAEQIFRFSDEGNQINGYTIELFTQVNGNLRTSDISPAQF